MRFKKLGRIFNPIDHKLPHNCKEFAQSPQAVVFDEFVRIYFSTRERDLAGKYLSHVLFVDFDLAFSKILGIASNEVVKLGSLGSFDEHGIFPMNVLKEGDRILAYTTGWNRKVSTSADASIGLAVSENSGLTFEKYGTGPIMTWSLNEPFLVGDGFVKKYDGQFYMWYIFGVRWLTSEQEPIPQRVYKIAQATSSDGVFWVRDSRLIISDRLNSNECQALPTVIKIDNCYHMYFCYRDAFGFRHDRSRSYRIGYACSFDLVNWKRNDNLAGIDVSDHGWDSEMICYPHVFECNNNVYMLYNGNDFGKYGFGLAVLENT